MHTQVHNKDIDTRMYVHTYFMHIYIHTYEWFRIYFVPQGGYIYVLYTGVKYSSVWIQHCWSIFLWLPEIKGICGKEETNGFVCGERSKSLLCLNFRLSLGWERKVLFFQKMSIFKSLADRARRIFSFARVTRYSRVPVSHHLQKKICNSTSSTPAVSFKRSKMWSSQDFQALCRKRNSHMFMMLCRRAILHL